MHRTQDQWDARYVPVHHHQEQEEYPGPYGTEEIQPGAQKSNGPQRNQVTRTFLTEACSPHKP